MQLTLGEIRVDFVRDGTCRLDGGAMFGVVPKPLWNRVSPADERNRIRLGLGTLLVRTPEHTVLVDTGMGTGWSEKERDIYALENDPGLRAELAERGVVPEAVTHVVNTHLHFDHVGGNTVVDGDGHRPAFPNARYVVQRAEFDWAMAPTMRDRASYVPRTFVPVAEAGQFDFVEGEAEIVPGLSVRPLPGHTPNLQGVFVTGGGQTLLFPSDLCPTVGHLPFPWVMGYDLLPLVTLETRIATFTEAAEKGWIVAFQHEPDHPWGTVSLDGGRPRFAPVHDGE